MSDNTDAAAEINAIFQCDAELFRVISQHGFRPPVWKVTPEEATSLAAHFAALFRFPMPDTHVKTEQRDREAEQHVPLFRAIKQSGKW
jgi:hypothetical protein